MKNYYILSNGRVKRAQNTVFIESADGLAAEDGADGLDGLDGESGEVGEGAVLDLAAFAEGLAEQVGLVLAVALATGDDGYVHGAARSHWHEGLVPQRNQQSQAINGYISKPASYSVRVHPPPGTSG